MDERLEVARILARFKLAVRRNLQLSVDMQRMLQDTAYSERTLRSVEDAADDEDLLILALQLRELLQPRAVTPVTVPSAAVPPVMLAAQTPQPIGIGDSNQIRTYKFGARSW